MAFWRDQMRRGCEKFVFFCKNQSKTHGNLYLFVKKDTFFVFIYIFWYKLKKTCAFDVMWILGVGKEEGFATPAPKLRCSPIWCGASGDE